MVTALRGEEYRATNILTSIDQMARQYPNVRRWYDELSEVCDPNQGGVLWHYSDIDGESSAVQLMIAWKRNRPCAFLFLKH